MFELTFKIVIGCVFAYGVGGLMCYLFLCALDAVLTKLEQKGW